MPTFNRRHLGAAFATLVVLGLIVLYGGTIRTAIGIGILGIAWGLALGSNWRWVYWAFVVIGVLLLVPPAVDFYQWSSRKPRLIDEQNTVINDDRELLKSEDSLLLQYTDKTYQRKVLDDLARDNKALSEDESELRELQSETALRRTLQVDWKPVVAGMLLLCSGLGLLIGVKSTRRVG